MLCKIGAVEVWRILESNAPFLTPAELFPNAGPDVNALIEARASGSVDRTTGGLILPIQGFLLKTSNQIVLVDACVGNDKTVDFFTPWHQRSDGRFLAGLTQAGVTPADIDVVLCTHLHVDHVGWNTRLENGQWVPTFPKARYLMPTADLPAHERRPSEIYTESLLPVIAAGQAEMVDGEHEVGDGIRLMPTPGHTDGHVSVVIESGGARAVITGDAIHITAQCWHPDWQFKFDRDGDRAVLSRRHLLETAAAAGMEVLGTHFALPSRGRIVAKGETFTWVPLS